MHAPAFELPAALEAREPAEARGLARDAVRLMVARRADASIEHRRFCELPELLVPGDLLVVNVSATIPAAIAAQRADGSEVRVHVATRAPGLDDRWRVVELRSPDGARPVRGRAGERLVLAGGDGDTLELVAPYASGARLALARLYGPLSVEQLLTKHGEPIRYGYVSGGWPLAAYQNVYATVPGSAEMPSAGRPFTPELITTLGARGVRVAPLVLHAGVSSPERHEPPFPEQYELPEPTARLVAATRGWGGRVIAVGTTVVRALETAAQSDAGIAAARGWTNLVIGPERELRVVDGLITGWHEPEASHLQLLSAVAGAPLLARCYREALARRYLWHEFGDSHLIMP
ncbi:MAG: S-adenosylmethionine:tRNA ribosyltransferase-isomerase [Solirubrobacteraceae bacterium]|jgi:S-adenosylmethionine:tRNA ribosyltransferase-isomerase